MFVMDIRIPFNFSDSLHTIMQRAGYHYYRDINSDAESYIHRLGADFYPRFHVYVNQRDNLPILSLHLDQKKPLYAGAHAHNAEYDGEVVEREAQRIENFIQAAVKS